MEYGKVLPHEFKHVPFWAKKDLESNPFRHVNLHPGDVVMDCGAHVGMFAAAALEQDAGSVWCYEPVPKNLERLRANLECYGSRAVVVARALTGAAVETVRMNLSGFDGAHQLTVLAESMGKPPVRKTVEVKAVTFRSRLLKRQPDVVKLDVEGAEYEILASLRTGDLTGVRCLFVEFHPTADRDQKIAAAGQFIEAEGLVVVNDRRRAFTAVRKGGA